MIDYYKEKILSYLVDEERTNKNGRKNIGLADAEREDIQGGDEP